MFVFEIILIIGQGQAYLQLGVSDSVAARKLQGTPNQILAERPTKYTVVINVVPVESMIGMNELASSAPTATAFMGCVLVATTTAILSVVGLF